MSEHEISWGHHDLRIGIDVSPGGPPRLAAVHAHGVAFSTPATGMPLVEIGVLGHGRSWSAARYGDSVVGAELEYRSHLVDDEPGRCVLHVDAGHPATGLSVRTTMTSPPGTAAVRTHSRLTNDGSRPIVLQWVTSFVVGGLLAGPDGLEALDVHWAQNDWLAENRWRHEPARSLLPDLHRSAHQHDPRGRFGRTAAGTWSSDGHLPMGAVSDRGTGSTVLWQVEHNGAWHWQVGERSDGLYLAALGPTDAEHQWSRRLVPGESVETVPVTLALGAGARGFEAAAAAMTAHRRQARRPSGDHQRLPVIFNDYMNTLMGDPTTAALLPLIDAAAEVGAEYFCIDAGWYDDSAGWWDGVGAWEPATARFPGGIGQVLDHIRAAGMVPGLWVEPEVVGVNSPVASRLPAEAFFQRTGERVVEHGRYQLDLRHPAARKHLDAVVDRLVDELGVGYLKFDYNINAGVGTDVDADSAGDGLLRHNRAHLGWLDGLLDRHPGLVVENCASGGMRTDFAMGARAQVQSTSDQQDPLRYPPIAAAAAMAATPEQSASWSYPQPDFDDAAIAFTLCAGLLGRIHLSGHLDRMTPEQRRLVASAMTVYRELRPDIPASMPFWPIGLPAWEDPWIAHGLTGPDRSHLVVWRRSPIAPQHVRLVLPEAARAGRVQVRFPENGAGTSVNSDVLTVVLPSAPAAVLLTVHHPAPGSDRR